MEERREASIVMVGESDAAPVYATRAWLRGSGDGEGAELNFWGRSLDPGSGVEPLIGQLKHFLNCICK